MSLKIKPIHLVYRICLRDVFCHHSSRTQPRSFHRLLGEYELQHDPLHLQHGGNPRTVTNKGGEQNCCLLYCQRFSLKLKKKKKRLL